MFEIHIAVPISYNAEPMTRRVLSTLLGALMVMHCKNRVKHFSSAILGSLYTLGTDCTPYQKCCLSVSEKLNIERTN